MFLNEVREICADKRILGEMREAILSGSYPHNPTERTSLHMRKLHFATESSTKLPK